jgi:hypothetical protein
MGIRLGRADDQQSIAAIHRPLEFGLNWIDTAAGLRKWSLCSRQSYPPKRIDEPDRNLYRFKSEPISGGLR